jgi:hypothetical protein
VLATGSSDYSIRLRDLASGEQVNAVRGAHKGEVWGANLNVSALDT